MLVVLAAVLATSLSGIPLAIGVAWFYLADATHDAEHLASAAVRMWPTSWAMPRFSHAPR